MRYRNQNRWLSVAMFVILLSSMSVFPQRKLDTGPTNKYYPDSFDGYWQFTNVLYSTTKYRHTWTVYNDTVFHVVYEVRKATVKKKEEVKLIGTKFALVRANNRQLMFYGFFYEYEAFFDESRKLQGYNLYCTGTNEKGLKEPPINYRHISQFRLDRLWRA